MSRQAYTWCMWKGSGATATSRQLRGRCKSGFSRVQKVQMVQSVAPVAPIAPIAPIAPDCTQSHRPAKRELEFRDDGRLDAAVLLLELVLAVLHVRLDRRAQLHVDHLALHQRFAVGVLVGADRISARFVRYLC